MRMLDDDPGSPELPTTLTPGAFPASASTMFPSFERAMISEETVLRTLPTFSASVAMPAPVMTTSPSCSGLSSSTKSRVLPPAVNWSGTLDGL